MRRTAFRSARALDVLVRGVRSQREAVKEVQGLRRGELLAAEAQAFLDEVVPAGRLTDREIDELLEEYGIGRVVPEDDTLILGPFRVKKEPPSRREVTRGIPLDWYGHEAFLEVSLGAKVRGREGVIQWGDWEPLRGDSTFTVFDRARFYALWVALHAERWYKNDFIRFRLSLLPEEGEEFVVRHGGLNCAIQLLAARFPSRAHALKKIKIPEDGGFRAEQAMEAAKILKLNVVIKDRLGHEMWRSTKPDGTFLYNGVKHGKPVPPVVIYDYDGHALEDKPEPPKSKDLTVSLVDFDPTNYNKLREQFGLLSRVWPRQGGAIVERFMDTSIFVRQRKGYEAVEKRANELGVEDYKMIASPFGVEFQAWKAKNEFRATPELLSELWRAAALHPVPYCTGQKEAGLTADINSAYEHCPKVGARDLYEHYGMPDADGMIAVKEPPVEILRQTGLVVATLDLEKCHPWIRHQVKVKRGVFTTMRLHTWVELGAAVIESIELAIVARKYYPSLERPEAASWEPPSSCLPYGTPYEEKNVRHWARPAIGRLVPSQDAGTSVDWLYTTDDAEAAALVHGLKKDGLLGGYEYVTSAKAEVVTDDYDKLLAEIAEVLADLGAGQQGPEKEKEEAELTRGFHRIGMKKTGPVKSACYHAYAYYIDYTGIVIDREILKHEWKDIVKVKTDSISLVKNVKFSEDVVIDAAPGHWKYEKYGKQMYSEQEPRTVPALDTIKAGDYWAPLASETPMAILEAPPGYGKTTTCRKNLKDYPHVTLVPTRKMRKQFLKDNEHEKVYTWQWALRPRKSFVPEAVRIPRGSIVYIVEVGTWDRAWAEEALTWLIEEHKCRIIADGDRKQMPPYDGVSPWRWLDEWKHATILGCGDTDYRSKTEELAAFKLELRASTTNDQVIGKIAERVGATSYGAFLEEWHPRDYVYITTNKMRDRFHEDLGRLHAEKYPDAPKRIRYTEASKAKSGEEEFIAIDDPIPQDAKLAYTTTYSSCQGETAGVGEDGIRPRVWLVQHKFRMFENAVYVGATRVEVESQWGVVTEAPLTADEQALQEYLYG